MRTRDEHWPDEQIVKQTDPNSKIDEYKKRLSSICVDIASEMGYGTRTTTVVLVRRDGTARYRETNWEGGRGTVNDQTFRIE